MDKPIQEVFLKSWEIIGNILSFAYYKGIVAMGEDEGREFLFIGEKMTAMDVCDGDLVLPPLGFAGGGGERKKTGTQMLRASCLKLEINEFGFYEGLTPGGCQPFSLSSIFAS